MVRTRFVLLFCAGVVLSGGMAQAQCQGGGGGQGMAGTTSTTGTTTAALAGLSGIATGGQMLTGPGSMAYQMRVSQLAAQQIAQQRYQMAMQQQQAKQEKLAARQSRAERNRAELAESRARARAALSAKSGNSPARPQPLVAYQSRR